MVEEVKIPSLVAKDFAAVERWARNVATSVNEALRQLQAGGAFFVYKKCVTVPTSTTISGAEEITFDSPFAGKCTLLITGVGFEGGITIALNGTELGTLTNTDTTSEIIYDIASGDLVAGINSFKIWSTTTDAGELRRLEVRGVDIGGYNAFGALASQLIINNGVQIYENGDVTARSFANALAVLGVTDGQSVTFSPARANIPDILFLGGGAGQPTGTMATAAWYRDVQALNSTTSGFDVVAKFKTAPSTPTNVTDTGATGSSSTNWVIEKTATPEANDDTHTYQFDVTVQEANKVIIEGEEFITPSTITVAFDTRTILAGAWTERATQVYSNSDPDNDLVLTNKTRAIIVDGLGVDAAFRVRVKSTTTKGGDIPSFDQVTYTHSGTGGATQTMTPGTGEKDVIVLVVDGVEDTIE